MRGNAEAMKNEIAEEIRRRVKAGEIGEPCNFTRETEVGGEWWNYHAETEPHDHTRDTNDSAWTVEFAYFNRDYRFVFWRGGKIHSIIPRPRKPYEFDCLKMHAVIRKQDVPKFNQPSFWRRRFTGDPDKSGPLACVFRFV